LNHEKLQVYQVDFYDPADPAIDEYLVYVYFDPSVNEDTSQRSNSELQQGGLPKSWLTWILVRNRRQAKYLKQ